MPEYVTPDTLVGLPVGDIGEPRDLGRDISEREYQQELVDEKEKAEKLDSEIERLQEDLKGKPSGNVRDTLMQKKHLLTFERNYYNNKYKRFFWNDLIIS